MYAFGYFFFFTDILENIEPDINAASQKLKIVYDSCIKRSKFFLINHFKHSVINH